jgi:uncharacterized SAM-binding protein YcdF (DUF218 family)
MRARSALQAGLTTQIIACGGKTWNGVSETDALCAFLIEQGVPPHALQREPNSRSTRQNAHYAAKLLLPRGERRIWLVTCDWHMARALRSFEGAGFLPEPLPAPCPPIPIGQTLLRTVREHVCLGLDALLTRGFSRV